MSRRKHLTLTPGITFYDFTQKEDLMNDLIDYMLIRTQSMFTYEGLPDTIPQRDLELFLQLAGSVCITQVNGELYVFTGGLGGEPDVYYKPTIYTVSNPALNYSKSLKIGTDCIWMKNDSMFKGLVPMMSKYASMLAENEISMNMCSIFSRIVSLIAASDDRTKASAELFIKQIIEGKYSVIADTAFIDALKTMPYAGSSNNNAITSLIEYEQFIKASWLNDLGLQANYNMKRESINSNEAQLNEDALYPLIDDMLKCRQEALEEVNKMYDTNISVKLNSSWEDNRLELDAELEMLENAIDEPGEPESQKEGEEDEPEDIE